MPPGQPPGRVIVGTDGDSQISFIHRPPAHELGPLRHQLLEPLAIDRIVAVSQQDQPVRPVAILIAGVPVVLHPLERDEQIVPFGARRLGNRAQHGKEERIDLAVVGRRILEEQQGNRVRPLAAQRGCVLVDRIIEFARNLLDLLARRPADRSIATQGTADGRLRDPCPVGDIEAGDLAVRGTGHTHLVKMLPDRPKCIHDPGNARVLPRTVAIV